MMNPELFAAFLLVTVVLIVTPGPIVTLVIATGVTRGVPAALIVAAGTSAGNALLLGIIAFGLDWLLNWSVALFEAIRWAGAAYLIWLGVQAWRYAGVAAELPMLRHRVHFWRGFMVALSNPKSIAFFTAFLPQFVDPHLPVAPQLAVMCGVSVVLAALSDSGWAVAAGLGRGWFKSSQVKVLERLSGVALIGGGIWLSLSRRPV
jgi:homoserine/homoserine lactone efflux protein